MVNAFIDAHFDGIPVVFTADLNATPESESYRIMTEHLSDARLNAEKKQEYGKDGKELDSHDEAAHDQAGRQAGRQDNCALFGGTEYDTRDG